MWCGLDDFDFSSCSFAIRYGNEADETDSSGEEDGEEGTTRFSIFFPLIRLKHLKYHKGKAKLPFRIRNINILKYF